MMVEEKNIKVEKKEKESKKLDDIKETPENKEAIAKIENKIDDKKSKPVGTKKVVPKKSKGKKEKNFEVELEREYIVPLKKYTLKVPQYKRAKKAIRVLKEFVVKHMKVRDRDLRKVKIDIHLNNEIWFRGIKKPVNKIKVKAKKIDEIVYVELVDVPEVVKFKIAREEKKKAAISNVKKSKKEVKKKVSDDKTGDGVSDKKEDKEDKKSGTEKAVKDMKMDASKVKHTSKGSHSQKTMPVRKVLK